MLVATKVYVFTYENMITWWAFKIFSVDDWWSCKSRVFHAAVNLLLFSLFCYRYWNLSIHPSTDWRFLHLRKRKMCVENSSEYFTTPHVHTNISIPILFCSKSRTFWHHVENQLNTNNNKSVKTWMEFFKTVLHEGVVCTLRIFMYIDLRLHNSSRLQI